MTSPVDEASRHLSYACPPELVCERVDSTALEYLGDFLNEVADQQQGCRVVPISTLPDGNCMMQAASIGVWGTDQHSDLLRERVNAELEEHASWYIHMLDRAHPQSGAAELHEAVARGRTAGGHLSNVHVVCITPLCLEWLGLQCI